MKIEYTFQGAIPEKEYTLIRRDGVINQNEESKNWESEVKQLLNGIQGWTSKTDTEYGEFTPLQINIKIYTPHRPVLIKQIKAILDALAGIVYVDDCSIVDLTGERIHSDQEYAELLIQPAIKDNIKIPDGDYVCFDRYIGPIKNNVFDEAGYPLKKEDYEHDKELRQYIRTQFDEQLLDLIDGEFEMQAVFGTRDVGVEIPLEERIAAYNMDRWTVIKPDVDNCAYQILTALRNHTYGDPEDLQKIHITKTFNNPELGRNRILLKNIERNNYEIS